MRKLKVGDNTLWLAVFFLQEELDELQRIVDSEMDKHRRERNSIKKDITIKVTAVSSSASVIVHWCCFDGFKITLAASVLIYQVVQLAKTRLML